MDGGYCAQCGHPMAPGDKFCGECGQAQVALEPTEVTQSPSPGRSRRPLLIAGIAAIGVILAGAAWWGLTQNSAAKDQYTASGPVLIASLNDMSAVQSTEMVNDVAGAAQQQVTAITATLDEDPGASGVDRLTTLRDAFVALAALGAYEETNTQVWSDNRDALVASLDILTTYGGTTETASALGQDAVRTLDDLTRRVDKAMARYRKQVKKAKARARSQRADVGSYHAQMESLIDQYTALRNDTADYVEYMYAEDLYLYEVIDYFAQAATDRREIAGRMAALRPPTEMRAVHAPIVTVIGDGADAINSAVAALEDAECYDGECYFEFDAQWEQFQTESDRITTRYGQAYDAWQAAVATAEKQARGADLPPKPDL